MGLSIEDLRFGYRQGQPIIEELTTFIPQACVTVVTGQSGRGKSTLLYLLGGLLSPWSGRVAFDGLNITALPDEQRSAWRAEHCGFVFQDANLDPRRSVIDSVLEPALYAGQRKATLRWRAKRLMADLGVNVPVNSRPGEVSGGQAQRIALARALLLQPSVILADEPTGNLDDQSAGLVMSTLRGLASKGAMVIIATHDHQLVAASQHRIDLS
ncbi:MAG: ATP-binding cassette domain-containing protein [Propionibacteriaceae bacterium]|jgi:ABC-type lipoprotein export system ATPase subunit|nr:ATP-binding cassette domain-containing protein [Propionibacteriaceae bacterium]